MTNKTAISITRALSQVKSLDEQIKNYFNESRLLITMVKGDSEVGTANTSKVDLTKQIQADHDGIEGLIRRRDAIKSAIVLKNATTSITMTFGTVSKSITVAEAIVQKSLIPAKETLLSRFRSAYNQAVKDVEKAEREFDERVKLLVQGNISSEMTDEQRKNVQVEIAATQRSLVGPRIFDPKGLKDKIGTLEAEITFLKSELDFALSFSNTQTTIEVEL